MIRQTAARVWLRERTAAARTRFHEDYGHAAADLWDHHLATLGP